MSSGLVSQVTSLSVHTHGTSVGAALRDLNTRRRIRRMRRVAIASAKVAQDTLSARGHRYSTVLVTLTYAPGQRWSPDHISHYIRMQSQAAKRRGLKLRYQWVIELTANGAPHYHVLWWGPEGFRVRKPDAAGYWSYGMSRVERARAPVGYLIKYATKGGTEYFDLPKRARLFGVGGGEEHEKLATHRAGLPMWLIESISPEARAKKVSRVGWVDTITGEIHLTRFQVSWYRDEWGIAHVVITRVHNDVDQDQI